MLDLSLLIVLFFVMDGQKTSMQERILFNETYRSILATLVFKLSFGLRNAPASFRKFVEQGLYQVNINLMFKWPSPREHPKL